MEMMENEQKAVTALQGELRTAKARIAGLQASLPAFDDAAARRKLGDNINKEGQVITELEHRITDSEGKISAFDEAIKLLPKDHAQSRDLRPGSELAKVRDLIRAKGQPLTLDDILRGLNYECDDKKRNSLRGSLSNYARDGRIFTKEDAPDTFGLLELENGSESKGELPAENENT